MNKFNQKKTIAYAFKQSLFIMPGYLVLGTGFGILLQSKGFGLIYSVAMSVFIYAGSMQYVGVELLASSASFVLTAIMSLMINIRHLFYGISMLEKYKDLGALKPYSIFALTDETYSLVCSGEIPNEVDEKHYYFYLSLMNQIYWIIGSIIGSLFGNILPFSCQGIEFSMTALFIVILLGQYETNKNHDICYLGFGVSICCLLLFGSNNFLIPTMLVITIVLLIKRKIKVQGGKHE